MDSKEEKDVWLITHVRLGAFNTYAYNYFEKSISVLRIRWFLQTRTGWRSQLLQSSVYGSLLGQNEKYVRPTLNL